jgi:hypothetical protein
VTAHVARHALGIIAATGRLYTSKMKYTLHNNYMLELAATIRGNKLGLSSHAFNVFLPRVVL